MENHGAGDCQHLEKDRDGRWRIMGQVTVSIWRRIGMEDGESWDR